jgi:hypothetical protein
MKPRKVSDADVALISSILEYRDGGVFWLENRGPNAKKGTRAGCVHSLSGYRIIGIKARTYREHRLCWLLVHGVMPSGGLDHINGIKTDNRVENLREASVIQNNRAFKTPRKGVSSKYRGVSFLKSYGKWVASIKKDGRSIHIGRFTSETEAGRAYDKKAIEFGFDVQALNFKQEGSE